MLTKLAAITRKLFIYSARDDKVLASGEDRNFGYESKKFYQNTERRYYCFPPRNKLNRSFENLCRYTTNIKEKELQKNVHSAKWLHMVEEIIWKSF